MSDDWKYRDLPRAANGIAPAQWNPDTKQYEVYEGDRRILDKLERIERRLNEPLDTQLTGSRVELIFTRAQTLVPSGVNMGVNLVINVSKYKYVFIQFAPGGTAGLNQYKLHIRTLRGDTTSAFRQTTVLDGQSGSNNETDFINVKSLNIAVYVENLTSEDRTFDYIHLFGVRA